MDPLKLLVCDGDQLPQHDLSSGLCCCRLVVAGRRLRQEACLDCRTEMGLMELAVAVHISDPALRSLRSAPATQTLPQNRRKKRNNSSSVRRPQGPHLSARSTSLLFTSGFKVYLKGLEGGGTE